MNENKTSCAPADNQQTSWNSIDWLKAELIIRKLQARIVKAQKEGRYGKVKALQWTKIQNFNIARLRTEEDFGFQKRIEAETALLTVETDQAMVTTYKAALTAFDDALKGNSRNPHSPAVTQADELADAAAEAYALITKYGVPTSMPYNEEYGRLHNLLQDLTALGTEKQAQIYITAWVTELRTRYDQFMTATAARDAEESLRTTGIVKQARTDADRAYRALYERVNALALVKDEADYATFIDRVNVIIDQANATLAGRSTRAEKKKKG